MAQPRAARTQRSTVPEGRQSEPTAQHEADSSQAAEQDRVESVGTASARDVSPNTPRGEPV